MKCLILFALLVSGCASNCVKPFSAPDPIVTPTQRPEPKFALDQKVIYKVDPFYRLVCSGHGTVTNVFYNEGYFYNIRTQQQDSDCPLIIPINEQDLKAE